MLKLIFKTILIIFILFVVTVVLAIWKGGEPFRWTGEKIAIAGRAVEKFGDTIDGIKKDSGKIKKKITELKENLDLKQNSRQEELLEDKNGDINKDK